MMGRLEDRWERRASTYRDGRESLTIQSAVMVLTTPQAVWEFLDAPGSKVLLDSKHLKTFPVPGTPAEGPGHQFCTLRLRDGEALTAAVHEIVEHTPPHRSVTKLLNGDAPYIERLTLAEVPGGCSLSLNVGTRIPAGSLTRVGPKMQENLDEYLAKVKALIERPTKG